MRLPVLVSLGIVSFPSSRVGWFACSVCRPALRACRRRFALPPFGKLCAVRRTILRGFAPAQFSV